MVLTGQPLSNRITAQQLYRPSQVLIRVWPAKRPPPCRAATAADRVVADASSPGHGFRTPGVGASLEPLLSRPAAAAPAEPSRVTMRRLGCQRQSWPLRLPSGAGRRETDMYQLQCGHEQCGSQLTSSDKDDLMRQLAQHLRDVHNVHRVTETLIKYLESRCLTIQQSPADAANHPARHTGLARPRLATPFRFRAGQAGRRLIGSPST